MERLASIVLSSTDDVFGEEMILSETTSPIAAWSASSDLTFRFSQGSIWFQELDSGANGSNGGRYSVAGADKSLFYLIDSDQLAVADWSTLNDIFDDPVVVDPGPVDVFAVPEHNSSFSVVYVEGQKLYSRSRSGDDWGSQTELVSETSNITSLSYDFNDGYRLIAYATADNRVEFYSLSGYGTPPSISEGDVVSNVVLKLSNTYDFDMLYERGIGSSRSIQHVFRDGSTIYSDTVASGSDHHNPDLEVESDGNAHAVWISGGYLNYRSKSSPWVGLSDAYYVDSADDDSFPKVVMSYGYPRIIYKKDGYAWYNGLLPGDDDFAGVFYVSAWNSTKFVETSNTSVTSVTVTNRLSQRVRLTQEEVMVGNVAVNLERHLDDDDATFTLVLELRYADSDGTPGALVDTATLASSAIDETAWYQFNFGTAEEETPAAGYCLVMYQTGGDENNFATWNHTFAIGESDAYVSRDGSTWTLEQDVVRSVRIQSSFDAYSRIINSDPTKITYQIVTPPADPATDSQSDTELESGTFDNTKLTDHAVDPGYYPAPTETVKAVILDQKNLHVSFVVDSSGSSGWNDPFGLRAATMQETIDRLSSTFPGDITYDVVRFGGRELSLIAPSFTKRVRGVVVNVADVSTIKGFDSDGNPLTAANVTDYLGTGIVAYGFKNLKSGSPYVVYGYNLGWKETIYADASSRWRDMWATGSPSSTVAANGPENIETLNLTVSDTTKDASRYFIAGLAGDFSTGLSSDAVAGVTNYPVVDSSGFAVNDQVNVVDSNGFEVQRFVTAVNDSPDSIDVEQTSLLSYTTADGALMESYDAPKTEKGWEATNAFEFFVLDEDARGKIVFYVQTLNGAHIEWEFEPLVEWEFVNLYYTDETALFEVDAVDANDESLPDGTLVEWYVDKQPNLELQEEEDGKQDEILLTADAASGTTVVYVSEDDIAKFARNDEIDIIDVDRNPEKFVESGTKTYVTTIISEVNAVLGRLTIADPLSSAYLVSKQASILLPATREGDLEIQLVTPLPIFANLVDITPIYTGSQLPAGLFSDLDPPQADPSADIDAYNDDPTRVRRITASVLTNGGWSAIRLGPIPEESFLDQEVKDTLAKSMFNITEREQVRLDAVAAVEKGEETGEEDLAVAEPEAEEEAVATSYYDGVPDFVMDYRTFVSNGYTSTTMKSFPSTEVEQVEVGGREYLARLYQINPVMTIFNSSGEELAIILMGGSEVYFAIPITIQNEVDDTVFYRGCPGEEGSTFEREVAGVYASSGNTVTINYTVTEKDFPTDGSLLINIYDARRNLDTRHVADDELGELSGCSDDLNLTGGVLTLSTGQQNDEYETSVANSLLAEDLLGDSPASYTVQAVNGEVSITIPALDRVALLEVHAIFDVPDSDQKVVNKQTVYYKNPVVITYVGTLSGDADGETKYNIGATVSWMELYPVNDGTIVNFAPGETPMSPSVSQTVTGLADGVILGPHEPITKDSTYGGQVEEDGTVLETIVVSTSYRGFYSEIDANIEWGGGDAPPGNFYFYVSGSNTNSDSTYSGSNNLWADGIDYISMNGDLPASSNKGFPFIDEVSPDLIEDRMGVVYSGGITVSTRLPRWSSEPPPEGPYETGDSGEVGWVHNKCYVNRFIGRPPKREASDEQPPPCGSPECVEVSLFTRSRKFGVTGIGIKSDTVSFLQTTLLGGEAKVPKPRIYPIEPLGICVSMEPKDRGEYQSAVWPELSPCASPKGPGYSTENYPIKRDGSATYFIVAEVSWRDLVIKSKTGNLLPIVTFRAGTTATTEAGDIEFTPFEDPDDFPLDASTKRVDHLRTTYDHDHYHEVVIGDNNKGNTVSTITYTQGRTVADHVHEVNLELDPDYIIGNAISTNDEGFSIDHNHDLRATAIIGGGPAKNQSMGLAVEGVVTYDAGRVKPDGTRVSRTLENYAFANITVGSGSGESEVGFSLEIIPVGKQYVNGAIVDAWSTALNGAADGNTVLFHATQTLADGSVLPVPDGTRIFTTFRFYEAEDDETKSSVIIIGGGQDEPRNYALTGITAILSDIPEEVKATKKVLFTSSINWFPDVSPAPSMRFPTNDSQYIADAIASITELGSSQVNDALALAARRMITFEDELSGSSKLILLVSDGGENLSELSYSQATAEVNAVTSDGVAIIAVKLADTELYDDLVMKKFAEDTGGEYVKVGNVAVSATDTSEEVVDMVLTSESLDILFGKYTNTVDLGENALFSELRFLSVDVAGTSFSFRIRFSEDLKSWSVWTNIGAGPDYTITGDRISRYMQYEASLFGNPDNFESPILLGVEYDYFRPRGYTLFFQPFEIDEGKKGYVGEIIFAHKGNIPDTSTVRYGITHSISTDFKDYGSNCQPYMNDGISGIVLSRVNESVSTTDSRNYTAVNGSWHDSYEVDVYEVSSLSPYGALVNPSRYSLDNTTGTVSFSQAQPSNAVFTLTLGLKPFYRLGVDILNYGDDAAVLDYVGTMYRTVDRAEIAPDDYRPVTSIVGTDLLELNLSVSGSWSPELSVYNTEFGVDTDVFVDFFDLESVFYILGWNGTSAFIQTLAENLTSIRRVLMTDIAVQPTSFSYMDGSWYVAYTDASGDSRVSRRNTDFELVSTLDVTEDTYTGVIRPVVDRWYVPAENSILKYNRSFNFRESISVGADILPMLANSGENFLSPSVWRDMIFTVSLDGGILEVYSVSFAESAVNIELASGKLYIVFPTHFTRYGTG